MFPKTFIQQHLYRITSSLLLYIINLVWGIEETIPINKEKGQMTNLPYRV